MEPPGKSSSSQLLWSFIQRDVHSGFLVVRSDSKPLPPVALGVPEQCVGLERSSLSQLLTPREEDGPLSSQARTGGSRTRHMRVASDDLPSVTRDLGLVEQWLQQLDDRIPGDAFATRDGKLVGDIVTIEVI